MRAKACAAVVFLLAYLGALAGCERGAPAAAQDRLPEARYAPPASCRDCHAEIFAAYQHVSMALSLYRPTAANTIEDYRRKNHFFHAASNRHYRMIERGGKFYQQRYQLDAGRENNLLEQEVTYVIGSGNHARSYLHLAPSGELTELPVTWYSEEGRWGMSPGYDKPRHYDFTRPVDYNCIFCHDAYPEVPEKARRYGYQPRFPNPLPEGIDCQRCHGPGERHIELAAAGSGGARGAIVNPARLDAARQMDVCGACHLETTSARLPQAVQRFDRPFFSFRPGETLAAYQVHFDHSPSAGRGGKFEIVSAAYRLRQSRCFLESGGRLTCTTCHNPHRTSSGGEGLAQYRSACMKCHPRTASPHLDFAASNCMSCHMPRRRTEDVVHVVMTDHLIQRTTPRDPLAMLPETDSAYHGDLALYDPPQLPPAERDFYLGAALARDGVDRRRGIGLLEAAIARAKPVPLQAYVELAQAYAAEHRPAEAAEDYRKALEIDPQLPLIRYDLAKALSEGGRVQDARRQYEQALRDDPELADAHNNLGALLAAAGEAERSIAEFQAAIRARPVYADAHNNLANVYLGSGRTREAEVEIGEALRSDPDFAPAYNSRGILHAQQGKAALAAAAFERSVKLDPNSVEAHLNLGRARVALGSPGAAVAEFRLALGLDPNFAPAHFYLALVLAQSGQYADAAAEFRETLRLRPDYPEAQRYLQLLPTH
jgi:Tfp pilus assembly protein PilF